jgi:predicted Zn-dependent peptidase
VRRRGGGSLAAGAGVPGRLPGEVAEARLANGLHVCVLTNRQAPIVTTALWYRAGYRKQEEQK